MHSLLNETGDLFTQDVEKAVRISSSPQSLLARLTFRNPRSLKAGESVSEKTQHWWTRIRLDSI